MSTNRYAASEALFQRTRATTPGGVNSPVRALRAVGGTPFFAARGRGAWITDADGNDYVDYVLGYGPMILGHAHPAVVERITAAATLGASFGAPTAGEADLADLICGALPAIEMMRLVSTGTEACMSAIRVARGFTGRQGILKFKGCYHGHADYLLVKSGSGLATFGEPDSLGVPSETARNTLTAPFNDLEATKALFEARGAEIAAVVLEPVAGNMGVVPPAPGFLEGLRGLCNAYGALLVFDEVMTGFRLSWRGAQGFTEVVPDIVCLAKVIGGGLPVGAYGGRRDIMAVVSPLGGVYQAGTLSGNPISVAAGLATLDQLQDGRAYDALEQFTAALCEGLEAEAKRAGVPVKVQRVGSMFTVFFTDAASPPRQMDDVDQCRKDRFATFFHAMRERGVSLPPSQYEACFTSTAHGERELRHTLAAARESFAIVASPKSSGVFRAERAGRRDLARSGAQLSAGVAQPHRAPTGW